MPGDQFDSTLQLRAATTPPEVVAKGDLNTNDDVRELCVWIIQHDPNGNDAAATEMTGAKQASAVSQTPVGEPNRKWTMVVPTISDVALLKPGPAFAFAIALIEDAANNAQRVAIWGQTVNLV